MAASKKNKIRLKSEAGALIKKLRKPMARRLASITTRASTAEHVNVN
jgi:hypothetical protein